MEEGWESDSFQLGDWEVWQMKGASQEEVKPSTLRGPRVCFVLWVGPAVGQSLHIPS